MNVNTEEDARKESNDSAGSCGLRPDYRLEYLTPWSTSKNNNLSVTDNIEGDDDSNSIDDKGDFLDGGDGQDKARECEEIVIPTRSPTVTPSSTNKNNDLLVIDDNESDDDGNSIDDKNYYFRSNGHDETRECELTVIPAIGSAVVTEDVDLDVSGESFLSHYGAQIKSLIQLASDCDDIISDAINSELVYPQDVLSGVLDAVSKVKEFSAKVENDCQQFLAKLNQKKMDIGMPQLDNDFSSLSDPADRPTNLTDLQKQKVIELGPFQPKLKTYPTNPEIPEGKQCRFVKWVA